MRSTAVLSSFHVVPPFFHRPEAGTLRLLQIGGLQSICGYCKQPCQLSKEGDFALEGLGQAVAVHELNAKSSISWYMPKVKVLM